MHGGTGRSSGPRTSKTTSTSWEREDYVGGTNHHHSLPQIYATNTGRWVQLAATQWALLWIKARKPRKAAVNDGITFTRNPCVRAMCA